VGLHVGHDRAASVVIDGGLRAHLAAERLDRVKGSVGERLPLHCLDRLLDQEGVAWSAVAAVGVTYASCEPALYAARWADEVRAHAPTFRGEVLPVKHHDAHAWAAFATSPYSRAIIAVADGGGDLVGDALEAESFYLAENRDVRLLDQRLQDVPAATMSHLGCHGFDVLNPCDRLKRISLGRKYTQVTYTLGFRPGQEGKTMGLAAWGRPVETRMASRRGPWPFDLTYGDMLDDIAADWRRSGMSFGEYLRGRRADLAATAQRVLEDLWIPAVAHVAAEAPGWPVCGAGGVFLNCLMNGRLQARGAVPGLFVMPAAGDDGQSIGAAIAADRLVAPRSSKLPKEDQTWRRLPYIGLVATDADVRSAFERFGLHPTRLDLSSLVEMLADLIAEGSIVGLVRGRTELGPRALGHRSILADPRRPETKQRLDNEIKHREAFRPYAPMVTMEAADRYFDLDGPSPFMLRAVAVKDSMRARLPAITHVDATARVQTVAEANEPFLHALLSAFEKRSGVPVLLNTSFNDDAEPVVETPEDAVRTYLATGLDALVVETYLARKADATASADGSESEPT